jgi:hypothetical protein
MYNYRNMDQLAADLKASCVKPCEILCKIDQYSHKRQGRFLYITYIDKGQNEVQLEAWTRDKLEFLVFARMLLISNPTWNDIPFVEV